jgi:hypothetical protein
LEKKHQPSTTKLGATFQAMGSSKDKNNANFIVLNPSINKEDIFHLYIFTIMLVLPYLSYSLYRIEITQNL